MSKVETVFTRPSFEFDAQVEALTVDCASFVFSMSSKQTAFIESATVQIRNCHDGNLLSELGKDTHIRVTVEFINENP